LRHRLVGHRQGVRCIAFSPDGRTIATGGDITVKLWSAVTGLEMLSLEVGHEIRSVLFSEDGRHLAVCAETGAVRIYTAPLSSEIGHPVAELQ
jgi:WD40 repeat protein